VSRLPRGRRRPANLGSGVSSPPVLHLSRFQQQRAGNLAVTVRPNAANGSLSMNVTEWIGKCWPRQSVIEFRKLSEHIDRTVLWLHVAQTICKKAVTPGTSQRVSS